MMDDNHPALLLLLVATAAMTCLCAAQDIAYFPPLLEVAPPYPQVAVAGASQRGARYHDAERYLDDARHLDDSRGLTSYSAGRSGASEGFHRDGGQSGNSAGGFRARSGELLAGDEAHRKSHRTSGFRSSYRKDELALDTRFYDDGHDEAKAGAGAEREGFFGEEVRGEGSSGTHRAASEAGAMELEGARDEGKVLHSLGGVRGGQGVFGDEAVVHDVRRPHHHLHY